MNLNVIGPFWVTDAALPHLARAATDSSHGNADPVFISFTAGRVARSGASVYPLSKLGIAAFAESVRQGLILRDVRVSVTEPGTVDTELVSHLPGEVGIAARQQVAAIQPLRPDDIADAVLCVVTRDYGGTVNEMLIRAAQQTW